ncbi:MAG TPA: hypothetical protein VEI97_00795 [bacterium]|nr:hypothetical protein [bacterium]
MRILLDIDGTIAAWDTVKEHGFGPGTRPYDRRVHDLIAAHQVTLFSRNPEIGAWATLLGCEFLTKPSPGTPGLDLREVDVLIDDECEVFAYHCALAERFPSLDAFLAAHPAGTP